MKRKKIIRIFWLTTKAAFIPGGSDADEIRRQALEEALRPLRLDDMLDASPDGEVALDARQLRRGDGMLIRGQLYFVAEGGDRGLQTRFDDFKRTCDHGTDGTAKTVVQEVKKIGKKSQSEVGVKC